MVRIEIKREKGLEKKVKINFASTTPKKNNAIEKPIAGCCVKTTFSHELILRITSENFFLCFEKTKFFFLKVKEQRIKKIIKDSMFWCFLQKQNYL